MTNRIAEFMTVAVTIDPTDAATIKPVAEAEVQWLYANNASELTVAKKEIPRYKDALREAGLVRGKFYREYQEPWLLYLTADREKMQTYNDEYNHRKAVDVRGGQYVIHNADALITQAMRLIDNTTGYDTIAALCMLTGRREGEIGTTATFTPLTTDAIHVTFQGQLKGGELKRKEHIVIPTFGNRTAVCTALARLRSMYPTWATMDPDTFDAKVGSDVRKRVKKLFTPLFPDCPKSITAHLLRKAYAAIADAWVDHPRWSSNAYIAYIMGHEETDFSTVVAYQYFTVV